MAADPRIVDAFAKTDLFRGLDARALARVAETAKTVHHAAGKSLTSEGKSGIGFHLILEGTATVSVHGEERHALKAGDYFGEISLIDGKPRSATVTANADLTTASIVSWEFEPLLLEEPQVTKALLLVMCKRLRAAEKS
jgi:CRP/FNR family cyclic AMP-dependent transcriptional regulator